MMLNPELEVVMVLALKEGEHFYGYYPQAWGGKIQKVEIGKYIYSAPGRVKRIHVYDEQKSDERMITAINDVLDFNGVTGREIYEMTINPKPTYQELPWEEAILVYIG